MASFDDVNNARGILPASTPQDLMMMEKRVRETLEQMAARSLPDAEGISDIFVRNILPSEDLESGGDNGWNGDDQQFIQSGLTSGVNEVYDFNSNGRLDEKLLGIVGITSLAANPVTTQIEFESGTGGVFERLQIEGIYSEENVTGILANPVILGATQDGLVKQYATESGDDQLVYHAVIAETEGETLEDSNRFLSDRA
jgi:hypothetical protein